MGATASFRKATLRDVRWTGRRALVRVDMNVPLEDGRITDDTRIRASLETLGYLLDAGARVVLASHLGRPKGRPDPAYSLAPVAARLAELLGRPVPLAPAPAGPEAEAMAARLGPGEVLFLENVRFDPREEQNDPVFAAALARLGDVFVNDAFGAAHRAHASTAGVARVLPGVAGLLLERECRALGRLVDAPERPFWALLGGAKVSDKAAVLRRLLDRVDGLCLGGGMANTFLAAQGHDLAGSLVEDGALQVARDILAEAGRRGVRVLLPTDLVVAPEAAEGAPRAVVTPDAVPAGGRALDIGPATREAFAAAVAGARTVFWNGPMGVFEVAPFAEGTLAVARALAGLRGRAYTVVGGGDSVAALQALGLAGAPDHLSTGGGASLEFLEGRELPGVAWLRDAGTF